MSVQEVQSRIADIQARLAALSPAARTAAPAATPATAPRTSTSGGSGTPADFASQLATAQRARTSPAATAAPSAFGTALAPSSAGVPPGGSPAVSAPGRTSGVPEAQAGPDGSAVVATARRYLGVPYVWGGSSPRGFDCSGLVQYVYAQHGVSLPRTSSQQAREGRAVSPAQARPGDLVAFDNSSRRAGVDHIGIYIGDGKWIAAPRTGDVVKVQSVDLGKAVTIRRVLPERTTAAAETLPSAAVATLPGAGSPAVAPVLPGGSPAALPAWAAQLPAAAARHLPALLAAGRATGIDPRLLAAVAWTESGFSATARSGAGAQGLMQIMPATARGLGVDPLDPAQAALGAGRYLRQQLAAHGGRLDLALAAYNAGPGAVRAYGGIPPYAETRRYVTTVLDRYAHLGGTP